MGMDQHAYEFFLGELHDANIDKGVWKIISHTKI